MKIITSTILLFFGLFAILAPTATAGALPEHMVEIDEEVGAIRFVATVLPDKSSKGTATLTWNYTDSANFRYIRLQIQENGFETFDGELKSRYVYGAVHAGMDSVISEGKFIQETSAHGHPIGIQLDARPGGADVRIGVYKEYEAINVDFDLDTPGAIGIASNNRRIKILSEDIYYFPSDRHTKAPFESTDEMRKYLSTSQDPVEGLWMYFDSKCSPVMANISERYALATIRNGHGGYDIYYADGPKALSKKGTLTPTINNANHDLRWMDAHGTYLADSDAHAELATGGATLEFFFPALKSQVRYHRKNLK